MIHCTLLTFYYSGWFRAETDHDTVQPSIDMLLNLSVFFWFGAVCPWTSFSGNSVAPLGRLVAMSILILLLRRPPVMVLLYRFIPQIDTFKHALFVGFFGPIGVSAIFNLGLVLEFFRINGLDEEDDESGEVERGEKDSRSTFARMEEQIRVIVWFMVMSSVVCYSCPSLQNDDNCRCIKSLPYAADKIYQHSSFTGQVYR